MNHEFLKATTTKILVLAWRLFQ